MPHGQGQSPSRLEDPQHLANRSHRIREKHHRETAYHRVKAVGLSRESVTLQKQKTGVADFPALRFATSGFHHFRNHVHAHNVAFISNELGNGQCRFTRTRAYVQHTASVVNLGAID